MSGSRGGARVSIPAVVRPMIADIKAFGCNHSDEEIYAMLKECSMDLNETAQKLLLQDPFHEVKRKRDKRKENVKEPTDSKWRPGGQGRGARGGRGSYSSRDDAGGRKVTSGKDNGAQQGPELLPAKDNTSSLVLEETERKSTSSKSSVVHGPNYMEREIPSLTIKEENSAAEARMQPSKLISNVVKGIDSTSSDVVLMPSLDANSTGLVGTIRCEVGSSQITGSVTKSASHNVLTEFELLSASGKGSLDGNNFHGHGKMHKKSLKSEGNQLSDTSQVVSPSFPSSRPPSNYNNRSQQINNSQKVVSNKEWKPKSIPTNSTQDSAKLGTFDAPSVAEAVGDRLLASESVAIGETTSKIENKIDELQLSDRQHVFIPDHIQVSEDEIQRLNFGSFDSSFKLNTVFANGPDGDKSMVQLSDSSQEIDVTIEQPSTSPIVPDQELPDHPQSSLQMPESHLSGEEGTPDISTEQEHSQSKQEVTSGKEDPQISVVQTTSSYPSFGLVPPNLIPGSHSAPIESSESQASDSSRVPNFVVQQQFDPATNFYAQFYRSTADTDGRFSPFGSKYNGTVNVLPTQTGQSPQESGSSFVLTTNGTIPLTAQGAGAIPTSIAVPQQPFPFLRHPGGLHISHYPPNYHPYGPYFSPFFLPPPSLHHFLGSSAFPQQLPSGNIFPPGAAPTTTPVKYPLSQYKPVNSPGNSNIVGVTPGFGNYNSVSSGYTSNNAANNGNSTTNEDHNTAQYKENVYIPGQQSEASAVWIPTPGRDISGLQASSFYSIPPQGQHVTFGPSQAGHGGFSGIYHPSPTVATTAVHPFLQQPQTGAGAVEVVSPPPAIYQQPQQRSQVNWTNNY